MIYSSYKTESSRLKGG